MMLLSAWLLLASAGQAWAQLTTSEEERLQILTDPDALRKKLEKDKNRPPFEFFRSQVAPFDILPYVKANHWSTLTFEMRANDDNYDGLLETEAVKLSGMPHEIYFLRDGRLIKEQRARRALQIMVPDADGSGQVRKQFTVDLVRRGALRADATWQANLSTLPPHQMLIMILSKESTTKFAAWSRMAATLPSSAERDGGDLEKVRYYRLVLPIEPDILSLSSHPLDMDDDEPSRLGQLSPGLDLRCSAGSDARLAALGRANHPLRRPRAVVFGVAGEFSWPLSAGRSDRGHRVARRGRPSTAFAVVSAAALFVGRRQPE